MKDLNDRKHTNHTTHNSRNTTSTSLRMEKPKHNHHRRNILACTKHKHIQRRSTIPIHQWRNSIRSNTNNTNNVPNRMAIHSNLPNNDDIHIHTRNRYATRKI